MTTTACRQSMPLACRQYFLSNRGSNSAAVSCKSSSPCRSRHPRCQAQGTDLTDATILVSRRLACLAPLIGFGAFTLRPPSSSAAGIPSVLSQSLKKQLGGLWFADIPADLHLCISRLQLSAACKVSFVSDAIESCCALCM